MTAFEATGKPQPMADGEAPAVMLIHGMWSRPHVWDGFRAYFEDRGYEVIVPTLRHHEAAADGLPHPELATTSVADYASDIARADRRCLQLRLPFFMDIPARIQLMWFLAQAAASFVRGDALRRAERHGT